MIGSIDHRQRGPGGGQHADDELTRKYTVITYRYGQETLHKTCGRGQYVAEVDVELIDAGEVWSPNLSLEDAQKLDDVREALRRQDIKAAERLAQVFTLAAVTA